MPKRAPGSSALAVGKAISAGLESIRQQEETAAAQERQSQALFRQQQVQLAAGDVAQSRREKELAEQREFAIKSLLIQMTPEDRAAAEAYLKGKVPPPVSERDFITEHPYLTAAGGLVAGYAGYRGAKYGAGLVKRGVGALLRRGGAAKGAAEKAAATTAETYTAGK